MKKKDLNRILISTLLLFTFLAAAAGVVAAADKPAPPPTVESNKAAIELVQTHANYVWTLVAAALVFFMQAGFAMVKPALPGPKMPSI